MYELSICTGIAGLSIPGARTVCYVEREAYVAACLVARMQDQLLDQAPIHSDVTTFDPEPWRGLVDCITAGYPCQPFSLAGKRKGEDDPRHLWPYIRNIIHTLEPKLVFLENVPGHLSKGFETIHDDLQAMGFTVKAAIFSAEEVGLPHRRNRLFILATHPDRPIVWEQSRWGGGPNRPSPLQPADNGQEGTPPHPDRRRTGNSRGRPPEPTIRGMDDGIPVKLDKSGADK